MIPRPWLEPAGILLLVLYLLAGLVYAAVLAPTARFPDEQDYLALSQNLVHGPGFSLDGTHLTANRPPGYPIFLALLEAPGGGFFIFRAAQVFLLGATLFLLSRICFEQKPLAGLLVVTGLAVCYPALFYMTGTLYPQTLSAFLFILALGLIISPRRGIGTSLAAGFLFGALILAVPTFLLTLGVVLAAAGVLRIVHWREALMIAAAAALVVSLWTARNAIVLGHFVPIASNSGATFLIGNNEKSVADEGVGNIGALRYYDEADRLGLDEFQRDAYYRRAALDWIRANPGRAVVLYGEKVLNFFALTNKYAARSHEEVSAWKQIIMATGYLLLLGLLGWRLVRIRTLPLLSWEKLFLAVYILTAFTSAIFVTRIRYRLPYDFLIMAVAARQLCQCVNPAPPARSKAE